MILEKYKNIFGAYLIDSGVDGNTITIFSGIHGDEISGIAATKQFITQIKDGKISIESGKLIIVPECNVNAIKINKREEKYNLNRLFHNGNKGNSYEENRSKELMDILQDTDYLLDLHSTSKASIPFLFAEGTTVGFANKLGVSHIVTGWQNIDFGISYDAHTYIDTIGGKGFTFEAGSHLDCLAPKNAYQMILNFLSYFQIIQDKYFKKSGKINIFEIESVYINQSGKFKYCIENLHNFSVISKGTCIGMDGNESFIVKEEKILFMPKSENIVEQGVEVFFLLK